MVEKEIFTFDDKVINRYHGPIGKSLDINLLLDGRSLSSISVATDREAYMEIYLDDNKTLFDRILISSTIQKTYGFRPGNLILKLRLLNPADKNAELELQVISK